MIEPDFILLAEAAKGGDFTDPGNILQREFHIPVLDRPLFTKIDLRGIKRVPEYMPHTGSIRAKGRGHSIGKGGIHGAEAFQHPLACPVGIYIIFKNEVDKTHPEHRTRADILYTRQSLQIGDQRIGHLVFDQLRTAAHPFGKHNYLVL